jgi:N-formylglutamate deformylase
MQPFRFQKAYSPVLVCNAQGGSLIPENISESMTESGLQADASRLLIRFVDVSVLERAAVVTSNISRHVIDLDRPVNDATLIPMTNSSGDPIYQPAVFHSQTEIDDRISKFYQPFHNQITEELRRLVNQFGRAVLVDMTCTKASTEPAISIAISGDTISTRLEQLLQDWQCSIGDTHVVEFGPAKFGLVKKSDAKQADTGRPRAKKAVANSEILNRCAQLDGVTAIRVCVNEADFVDPDDGEFDFDTGRELTKSIESLMSLIMFWSQKCP